MSRLVAGCNGGAGGIEFVRKRQLAQQELRHSRDLNLLMWGKTVLTKCNGQSVYPLRGTTRRSQHLSLPEVDLECSRSACRRVRKIAKSDY